MSYDIFNHSQSDLRTPGNVQLKRSAKSQILIRSVLNDCLGKDNLMPISPTLSRRTQDMLDTKRFGLTEPGRDVREYLNTAWLLRLERIRDVGRTVRLSDDDGHVKLLKTAVENLCLYWLGGTAVNDDSIIKDDSTAQGAFVKISSPMRYTGRDLALRSQIRQMYQET